MNSRHSYMDCVAMSAMNSRHSYMDCVTMSAMLWIADTVTWTVYPCKNNWKERPFERRSGRVRTLQNRSNGLNERRSYTKTEHCHRSERRSFITRRWSGCLNVVLGTWTFLQSTKYQNGSAGKQRSDLNKIINKQFHCDAEINLAYVQNCFVQNSLVQTPAEETCRPTAIIAILSL